MKKFKPKTYNPKSKLVVILGQTASGKSDLAVKLAKRFKGEIISADSRQVYKGMDIGTGKITPDTKNSLNFSTGQAKKKYIFAHQGIPHYCIDVASPKRRFTVAQYQRLAQKEIKKILKKGKIPILCGGTGFYIQAVVDGILIPKVKPDWQLRKKLEKKETDELFKILKRMDSKRAKYIDKNNRRRLIRALEIVIKTKRSVPKLSKKHPRFDALLIGVRIDGKKLEKLIERRFFKWLKQGLFKEVKKIRKFGLSWKRIEEFGLHYRAMAQYLQKKVDYKEMVENSLQELQNYAKRQMTWFKRDKRIHWIKNQKETEKLIKNFLAKQKDL